MERSEKERSQEILRKGRKKNEENGEKKVEMEVNEEDAEEQKQERKEGKERRKRKCAGNKKKIIYIKRRKMKWECCEMKRK